MSAQTSLKQSFQQRYIGALVLMCGDSSMNPHLESISKYVYVLSTGLW